MNFCHTVFWSFVFATVSAVADVTPREVTLFDGWTFCSEGRGICQRVTVPHDWAIDTEFAKGVCPGQGDLPGYIGKGHYSRELDGFNPPHGGKTYLILDGVMNRSVVKLNGKVVGGRPFGYAPEIIDITAALKPKDNLLEVEAENVKDQCRWYSGAGIFREVKVKVMPMNHVIPDTVFITTKRADEKSAEVVVAFDWTGGHSNFTFKVDSPRLWSPENPFLYELELFGEIFRYGIRTAEFDPQNGFFLNGKHRQMRGVCMHHDLGPIGAKFDRDFARRQLTLLKEMGCDAIRTSHNPPAAALLELCDEMGVMVMDEAFDMWERSKGDYSNFWKEWHEKDLVKLVRRDRSHPCVMMWSIGNELLEHMDETPTDAMRIANELTAIVKREDPTRPVTFGSYMSAPMTNGCQNTVDVFGANYLPFRYAEFTKRNPKVGLIGTETCSTVSSRGVYFFPLHAPEIKCEADLAVRQQVGMKYMIRGSEMSGYDLWGPHPNDYPPDVEFRFQEENPQVYGEFVWTGFDYLGEPDPCRQTGGRSSYFGIFDLSGFPKDRYWLYLAQWRPEVPSAHILPHWSWAGREGEVTPVHVYSSGDEAELFVNGVSQGRKSRGRGEYRFVWDQVVYQPGEVRVQTWKRGKTWATDVVKTAGAFDHFERSERRFGKYVFITFKAADKEGNFCPTAAEPVDLGTDGGVKYILCNGDPACRVPFRTENQREPMRSYNGLLLAIREVEAK